MRGQKTMKGCHHRLYQSVLQKLFSEISVSIDTFLPHDYAFYKHTVDTQWSVEQTAHKKLFFINVAIMSLMSYMCKTKKTGNCVKTNLKEVDIHVQVHLNTQNKTKQISDALICFTESRT